MVDLDQNPVTVLAVKKPLIEKRVYLRLVHIYILFEAKPPLAQKMGTSLKPSTEFKSVSSCSKSIAECNVQRVLCYISTVWFGRN
jgi:hypothetical protein